jgi:REP-associated tyrosine transposase
VSVPAVSRVRHRDKAFAKEDIVCDDPDRAFWVWMLGRLTRRYGWSLLTYCLMTNHYHLLVRAGDAGLSGGMQLLNGGFARIMNIRYGRVGHLFQNRFYSKLVESDAHLLEAARYFELNPVRAGIRRDPRTGPGAATEPTSASTIPSQGAGELLAHLGSDPDAARAAYRRYVSEGRVLGSDTVTEV